MHKDQLSVRKSREHGRATSNGIKKAKKLKHAVQKAVSKSMGKSKADLASELFAAGGLNREEGGHDSPSVAARAPKKRPKKRPTRGTIPSAFAPSHDRETRVLV